MKSVALKLRLIYRPFLIISIAFILLYTFLYWLLFIQTTAIPIKENIVKLGIPIFLPWVPVLIWLRPRIRLLSLKTKSGNLPALFQMIAAVAMTVPTIIAVHYVEKATGKLTRLHDINQIVQHEPTKYYVLQTCFIDELNIGSHTTFDVSGKHNRDLNMHLYLALPLFAAASDTASAKCVAWLGFEYREQISNRLSNEEKEKQYQEFIYKSMEDFDNKNLYQFKYLERTGNSDDAEGFKKALRLSPKYTGNTNNVLLAVNGNFEERTGNSLLWLFGSFAIGAGLWLMMLLIAKKNDEALEKFEEGKEPEHEEDDLKAMLELFKFKEGYVITPVIIYINLLIFLIMVFAGLGLISFSASDLLAWGGNYRPSTIHGEWWRLFSNVFMHGGIMHLLMNMYGLLFAGAFLEPVMGTKKYLLTYLLTGVFASLASIWWYTATVSVGASGAIMGLYGVLLALLLRKVFPPFLNKGFLVSTSIFIGYNLLMGLAGGIDNAAHIGGLLSGFVIGLLLSPSLKTTQTNEQLWENEDHWYGRS